jgi:hypothetical protein
MLREKTRALIHADLIAALPGEDFSSFAEGFDRLWLALTSGPPSATGFEIQPGILKLLPGTFLLEGADTYGIRFQAEAPYEAVSTAALPEAELDTIKNFARFWERIVNRDPCPDLAPLLFPPGKPVFYAFMELSRYLLGRFGRNWGIDRKDLRGALEDFYSRRSASH